MAEVPDLYPGEPVAVRLMNTVWADRSGVHDSLQTAGHLDSWWSLVGFPAAGPATDSDVAAYRALRNALRRLSAQATGDARDHAKADGLGLDDALEVVNGHIARHAPRLHWEGDDRFALDWSPSSPGSVPDHLASLARDAARLIAGPEIPLRACYGPGCVLYFVREHSRREWCSAGCGNRARVARHYRRARSGGSH